MAVPYQGMVSQVVENPKPFVGTGALVVLLVTGLLAARLSVVIRVARTERPLDRHGYRVVCRVVGSALMITGLIMIIWLGQYALDI